VNNPLGLSVALDSITSDPDDAFVRRLESHIVQEFLSTRGQSHVGDIEWDVTTSYEIATPLASKDPARKYVRWARYGAVAAGLALVVGSIALSKRSSTIKSVPATDASTSVLSTTVPTSGAAVDSRPTTPQLSSTIPPAVTTATTSRPPAEGTVVDVRDLPASSSFELTRFAPERPGPLAQSPDGLLYIGGELSKRGNPVFNTFDESTGQWARYELPESEMLDDLDVDRWEVGPERVLYGFTSPATDDASADIVAVPMAGPKAGTVIARAATQPTRQSGDCNLSDEGIQCVDTEAAPPRYELRLAWVAPDGTPLGKTFRSQNERAWEALLSTIAVTDDDASFVQPSGHTITFRNAASAVGVYNGIATLFVQSALIAGDECALAGVSGAPGNGITMLTCRNLTTGVTTMRTSPTTPNHILTDKALYTLHQSSEDGTFWSIDRFSF
jgi:hypothetical protein